MNWRRIHFPVVLLAGLAVAFTVFSFAYTPIEMSQDEWWHLKTGEWIWQHHLHPPKNDIFAYTSENIRWDNHEWLAEVGMYLAWRAGEITNYGPMRAVITAKTLLWLAALLLAGWFGWRRARHVLPVLFVILLAATVGRHTLQPRPPLISYLLIVFFHYWLSAYNDDRLKARYLFLLPLTMFAWANLHGGFILGDIVIACYFLGDLLMAAWSRWRRNDPPMAHAALKRAAVLVGIGALTGLCSLGTPFGWRLYLLSGRVMSDKQLVSLIWELRSPFALYPLAMLWPYLTLAAIFLLGLIFAPRLTRPGEALLVAFLFWQSATHMRHMPLFALVAAPGCAAFCGAFLQWICAKARDRHWLRHGAELALGLLTIGLSLWYLCNHTERPDSFLDRTVELFKGHAYRTENYPVRLADFLEDADIRGRMYNDSRYAGYLIWRFSPERMKVFTDMRYDIFGGQFVRDDMTMRQGQIQLIDEHDQPSGTISWRDVDRKWHFDLIIADKLEGRFDEAGRERPQWLIRQLEESGEWVLIYADPPPERGLAVYLRKTPQNAAMIARAEQLAPDAHYFRPGRGEWGR